MRQIKSYSNKKCWLCERWIAIDPQPQWDMNRRILIQPQRICGDCFTKQVNRTYDRVFDKCAAFISVQLGLF